MKERCPDCKAEMRAELDMIGRISQLQLLNISINEILRNILRELSSHGAYKRGMISLFNRKAGSILVKEAYGATQEEQAKAIYYPGEGITGEVVESGQSIIVPSIRDDQRILNRMDMSDELLDSSFVCVPIRSAQEVIGTLSILKKNDGDALEDDERVLTIVAAMIAQTAQVSRSRDEESLLGQRESQNKGRVKNPPNIIGNSKVMQPVYQMIEKVGPVTSTILILGESGVGKERVAEALHYASRRANKAFIKLNCAALAESIIESELFGHEKGSFTGALTSRKGRFEMAHGGTLFLDEIGEISMGIQAKLLRILQEKEFERVGGSETLTCDVRIIAATNKNLEERVKSGQFREDLYYRLNIIPIVIPPLRERKTDILLLSDHFIEKYKLMNKKEIYRISTPAIEILMAYHWPGNVRELENSIERAVILSEDGVIHGYHLPPSMQMAGPQFKDRLFEGTLQQKLESIEYEMIVETLKVTEGNLSRAAEILGLTNRMMGNRVKKYGINFKDYRETHLTIHPGEQEI